MITYDCVRLHFIYALFSLAHLIFAVFHPNISLLPLFLSFLVDIFLYYMLVGKICCICMYSAVYKFFVETCEDITSLLPVA